MMLRQRQLRLAIPMLIAAELQPASCALIDAERQLAQRTHLTQKDDLCRCRSQPHYHCHYRCLHCQHSFTGC